MRYLYIVIGLMLSLTGCGPAGHAPNIDKIVSAESVPVVIGHTYTIPSSVYGGMRKISVKLPVQYAMDKKKIQNFPVLYLIDGGTEQGFPHIAGMLQSIDINWTLQPVILVGVETVDRRYEVSPPSNDKRYKKVIHKKIGGSQELRDFIRKDVMPWVENKYRVNNDKAVMGESLAGLWIVETLLKEPDLFTKYAAISPSLWWDNMDVAKSSKEAFEKSPSGERQLYLTMGNEGWSMQKGLDVLVENLEQGAPEGLKWRYIDRRNSEHHGSVYHPSALDALRTFYPMAHREGHSPDAFYLFVDGKGPMISERVKKDMKNECTNETAHVTSFAEFNENYADWNGLCILMKPGAVPTKGNY